jgi:hypothetical protein
LLLERLESRDCPAVFVNVVGGNLSVLSVNSQSVDVIQTNADSFQIRENGAVVRNVSGVTGNMSVMMGPHGQAALNIDFNGFATIDHVAAFLGAGGGVDVNILDGAITRSLSIVGGTGRDRVFLGGDGNDLTVQGFTNINLLTGTDDLFVRANVTLNERLVSGFVERVFLDAGSTANKNVLVFGGPFGNRLDINGTVGGSVSFTGSLFADVVNMGVGATIASNLNLALLAGNDTVNLDGAIGNDLSIFSAPFTGNKTINLGGSVGHNALVDIGVGNDTVNFTGIITNDLTMFTRFGTDFVEFDDLSSVNNANVHLGFSDDTFCLHATATINGAATIDGGQNSTASPGNRFVTPLPAVPANVTLKNFQTISVLTPC